MSLTPSMPEIRRRVYELGSLIEPICESCHLGFWYPGQGNPDYSFDAR